MGRVSTIEAPVSSPPSQAGPPQILRRVGRIRPSIGYLIGLLLTAVAMITLPLIYLSVIAAMGYAIYWHATENLAWLKPAAGEFRVYRARLVGYGAPFVVGGILIFFMIKPLLARRISLDEPLSLDPGQEPRLFAFVHTVCDCFGAPVPKRIDVDCSINAAAGFRRGLRSFFGNDLVLQLGLPLVAGMSAAQLAGVVAHELGHFSQSVAMRASFLIRMVNRWLGRVAIERDEWDLWLRETALDSEGNTFFRLLACLAIVAVWITRLFLRLLLVLGNLLSAFMDRQMEFNADRFEAALVGAAVFEQSCHRLAHLQIAWHLAIQDLEMAWQERRLADNLPVLIARKASAIPPEIEEKIGQSIQKSRTRLFDTHPSNHSRIRAVQKYSPEPALRIDGPATDLFSNFKMAAHAVTISYYRDGVGLAVESSNLIPSDHLLRNADQHRSEASNASKYFDPPLTFDALLFLGAVAIDPPTDPRHSAQQLGAAIKKLRDAKPRVEKVLNGHALVDERLDDAVVLAAYHRSEVELRSKFLKGQKPDMGALEQAAQQARDEQGGLAKSVETIQRLRRLRLLNALTLLHVPLIQKRIEGAAAKLCEAMRIVSALERIESIYGSWRSMVRELITSCQALEFVQNETELKECLPKAAAIAKRHAELARMHIADIHSGLAQAPYPFTQAGTLRSIGSFVFEAGDMTGRSIGAVARLGQSVHANLDQLYHRSMARLATIALEVEGVLREMAAKTASKKTG